MMLMIFVLSPCFLLSLELFRSLSLACKLLPSSLVLLVGGSDAARVFAFFLVSFEFGLTLPTAPIKLT